MGFNYRQAIGELIYAYTICRIDIAIAVITLSQFSHHPAKIHYEAVKQVFVYLNATKDFGLTYWRPTPRDDLPEKQAPQTISPYNRLADFDQQTNAIQLRGSCDATWASDRLERRSMGGVAMMLAGAAVYYKTRLQPTVALSSTEAEFVNMADAGKAALYIRWILEELGLIQIEPTPICADNTGAICLANAQKPTRRCRHVEMKNFVILQWTDDDFINFVETKTQYQPTDSLSKPTDRTKFYEHMDVLMGRRKPQFIKERNTIVHYIQRQGENKPSLDLNPLYDLTIQSHHEFSHNSYW